MALDRILFEACIRVAATNDVGARLAMAFAMARLCISPTSKVASPVGAPVSLAAIACGAQRSLRRHHFAHHVRTGCDGGNESVLHRLAKEIFLNLPYVLVPPYDFRREKHFRNGSAVTHVERLAAGGKVPIDAVRLEAPYPGVRPDIEIESQESACSWRSR